MALSKIFAQRRIEKIILQAQSEPTPLKWLETCPVRLKNKLKQAHWYAKSDSQVKPKQAHRYAKPGSRLCQIRLKNKPNQAHMPYKCARPGTQTYQIRLKSGDHYETHWEENPVILSTQSRTKASDTPTTRRSKLGVKTRKLNAL